MNRVIDCLQIDHEWRLVLLSVAVGLLTSFAGINTFQRAVGSRNPSINWLLTAGIMTGCGIWAMHFIAILAFEPRFDRIDLTLTGLSLALAAALVTAGFAVALIRDTWPCSAIGGLLIGNAIAVMHYTGIAALDFPTLIGWSFGQVAVSVVAGQFLAVIAMLVVGHRQSLAALAAGGVLLAFAIAAHHFIGMSAMVMNHQPFDFAVTAAARFALSIAITLVMSAIIVASTINSLVERRARRKLAERNILLNAALDNMIQGLCVFDADGRVRLFNPRFLEIYALRPSAVRSGATIDDLDAARRAAGTMFRYEKGMETSPERRDAANRTLALDDGRTIGVASCALPDGGWVVTHSDITQRLRDAARIAYMAEHDALTGLANRPAFNQRLEDAVSAAEEAGGGFALIYVDIDDFRQTNALFGESASDDVLRAFADRLTLAADGAFVARLANDDFAIISKAGDQPRTAEDICARIAAVFTPQSAIHQHKATESCAIGVSLFPQDAIDAATLRVHADVALERAKAGGSGGVCFFEAAIDEQAQARRDLQKDLAAAVAAEKLELYFQPQVLADGTVSGFEVLLRWIDRKRGSVSPADFVPVAEELGLIQSIDAWVVHHACREAASWAHPLPIAVNLSGASFVSGDIVKLIDSALEASGLDPSRLEIEITESVLIDDFESVTALLHAIKQRGVRIAMDDFGTGYSSLSYLQAFPFDKLKIDKSFIRDAATSDNSASIVRAIIGLGHALRLKVLAEGVESEAQREFLLRNGCDELQGFLIGRPKPIGHYGALIAPSAAEMSQRAFAI